MGRNLGKRDLRMRGGGLQRPASHSATARHRVRRKEKVYGIEKDKSPKAKDRWDNLRKYGKKLAKLRPRIHN